MLRSLFFIIFISTIYTQHFSIVIEDTGESTLFIFQNSISTLDIGDEIGLFDLNGIIDDNGNQGEILVGSGIWEGQQLNIATIMSVNLSDFGGPILPGANSGNSMVLKVWDVSANVEYLAQDYSIGSGSGSFNSLFTVISEISVCDIPEEFCDCDGNILDQCGICGGDNSLCLGCDGIPNSGLVNDECGVCAGSGEDVDQDDLCDDLDDCIGIYDSCGICNGPGILDGNCDCLGNIDLGCGCGEIGPSGCDDVCGSILEFDECGICGGSGILDGYCDCLGNILDCVGNCGGTAVDLGCGCGVDGPSGCDEICGSVSELDDCGVCGGIGEDIDQDGICDDIDECIDSNGIATDLYGRTCLDYTAYPSQCGLFDDDDFDSISMCCACINEGENNLIDYASTIDPVFQESCVQCHSNGGNYSGGLDLTSFENLMVGGSSGSIVTPFNSSSSLLIEKISGTSAGTQMPIGADPLESNLINIISLWIDSGAIGPNDDSPLNCNEDEIEDCNGNCFEIELLENGICNDAFDGEGANFNCSSLFFDGNCLNNFDNCIPDCPVGIIDFGEVYVDLGGNGSITGQLDIIMNCEFDVSEFEINLSEASIITNILNGTAVNNEFDIDFVNNSIIGQQDTISLDPGEQLILSVNFETFDNELCFDSSIITTSIGISYNAELGSCISIGSYPIGWNWTSVNQSFDDMNLTSVLQQIDGNAEFIKSQSGYADYYDGFGWFGTLETIDNISMYKLRMENPDAIAFRGSYINVSEQLIDLSAGWNWIGYVPQNSLSLETALLNIPEGYAEFIKSQSSYADYYEGFGWFGTLENLSPLLGYLLRMVESTEFIYNEGGMARMSTLSDISYDDYDLDIHAYEHNATMTSAVYVDNARIDTYDYVLSAYDGTKCVGYTEGLYFPLDGNIVFPLMVYGNEEGAPLTLKVYNKLTQEYQDINEEFIFTPDMILGDGFSPVVLNSTETPIEHSISAAYPNPFNPVVNFDIDLDGDHYVDARVYNLSGQEVAVIHDGMLSGNAQKLTWMAVNQSSGIYFIKVAVDGILATNNKIILLK